ncbi:hypothetical protein QO003_001120 [Arthrobacter silviterrae]|uniref:Uncharacterized protein n=1 Tax=Arthrobacter silviterrae TaxID=2026658 RepID=A0ABX0DBC4_9MICC|nr:hypothetical protein [Arthrobacter silviterrae]MDQ0276817.1 hypothetical protein [Arthrobacter silviterrae]NGN83046.1 hypothetical protein [Arthrobacter silviterrae]
MRTKQICRRGSSQEAHHEKIADSWGDSEEDLPDFWKHCSGFAGIDRLLFGKWFPDGDYGLRKCPREIC